MFNLTRAILIVSLADMSANSIDRSVMGIGSRIRGKVTGSYPDVALDVHTRTLE
jgi:hypothetical protein